MNAESGSGSSGTFTWGVIAGIAVLAAAGGLYLSGFIAGGPHTTALQPDVAVQTTQDPSDDAGPESTGAAATEDQTPAAPEPEATGATSDQGDAEVQPETDTTGQTAKAEPAATPPTLDQIFVERDGNTVLSGNAEPGAEIRVLLDGEQVHSFTVDASGQFAEFLSIPFSDQARGLTLEAAGGGQPLRSDDYLIAALPDPQPESQEVASAETSEAAPTGDDTETNVAEAPSASATAGDEAATPEPEVETADAGPEPAEDASEQTAQATTEEQSEQTAQATPEDDAQDQQVAVLRSGEDGVELVQPPTSQPSEPEQVALDTIGYSQSGKVELTGRVPEGSVVRLYLDNRLVDDPAPADDGKWRSELEGIDPGVYTLRVDEVAADGTVVSRLETPFKREPVEALQAAEAAEALTDEPETLPIRSVTVQKGDTLWAISRERFGEGILYVRLFEANRDSIRDPDLIYPGQIFTIPE